MLTHYPAMPHYPQHSGEVKLAAGWLIDQCALKGYRFGGAAVHRQQALVLINEDNATPQDIVALAHHVRQEVGKNLPCGWSQKYVSLARRASVTPSR